MESPEKRDQELPDGWVLCKSKSIPGRNYYFNRKTGKSSWTQPQDDEDYQKKTCKKEKLLKKQDKRNREETTKKVAKRKSDGNEECTSKKKTKQDTTDASCSNISNTSKSGNISKYSNTSNTGNLSNYSNKQSPIQNERKRKIDTPQSTSTPNRLPKSTPPKTVTSRSAPSSAETSHKHSPIKNLANTRLSNLRSMLNAEVKNEESLETSPSKNKISPKNETPQKSKTERKSPLNDSKTTQSPSSDSLQSIPSPSQFFAANKIISSMKAQLPEEYCNKEKQKDTFADIEKGICSQTPEYPFSKHPATPPQFSEASKLVSAIKSKLAYKVSSSKDVKPYSSAKDRMESLRANLSLEAEREGGSFLNKSNELDPIKHVEAMETEDIREVKCNIPTFPVQKENVTNTDNVILVVDTNIFIHDLDCIKNVLNSHIKGYSEQPTLLVPWRVINELDRLKDNNNGNGALCKRAKAAMDYLYKSLPENSRIKGQSLRDANSHIYPCEVPDDEILNCSLQQVERGRNVILVSNDKNLCNKASINGVKRIDVRELKNLVENKPQPSNPDLLASVKRYQQTIYHLLANILENEMRAMYDNLWQHVLFKAPPWTLADVLQCLLKHWIAVFNEVFPRIEHLITDLKNSLMTIEKKNPNTLTQSEVANFKELCLDVAKRCQIIPEYMELAKATVERLLRNGNEVDGTDAVVDAFEGLWTVFSSYCAKLSNALGIPHSIEDKLSGNEPLAVLTSKWTLFSGHVNDLTLAIQGVLNTDITESIDTHVQRLECVFRDALSAICMNNIVTREDLHSFCIKCRNMLQEAHSKFSQLTEILNVCNNRLFSDNNMN
ncbi:transcriptional protein SWT1-like [Pararge aegeria]|uniref:transcriptional protein SWT1-like n=1 Tax=Pararge aegeria TaxID=116150 RepID=UPI0019D0D0B6|nr:transcriptional protein SWT1-like [Pararge aegeria]